MAEQNRSLKINCRRAFLAALFTLFPGLVIAQNRIDIIAQTGQVAPDGNGTFSSLAVPVLNDSGQLALVGLLTGTSGSFIDTSGIFRSNGESLTQIVRGGPAGNTFSVFNINSQIALNESSQAAFRADLAGVLNARGIFHGSGGSITQIAREGQAAPDGNGTFSSFGGNPVLNDVGQVAVFANLIGTSGGGSDDIGIFTGDGIDLLNVARKGDSFAGRTLTSMSIGKNALNRHGQIAYQAILANGDQVISLWTPDLHWRTPFSGTWETIGRWTLGLNPSQVHNVFIDPAASLTVTGPAAHATVRSLQIGGGSGLATFNLRNGAVLTVNKGVVIHSTGTLTGDGTIAGNVTNNGTILANNVTVTNTLINNHVIRGSGRIDANIFNSANGKVRALDGAQLWLSGGAFANGGLVEINNAELQIDAFVLNQASTGLLSIRSGSLIADAGIGNKGSIAMTQGGSSIQADIDNTGIIQISGGAHATFFGDLTQNGTLQVATIGNSSSTAVFLGEFSGSGGFVGGGDVYALGDLRPGNSPDNVLYDGNLFLGATTDTFIELGGLGMGDFDQMVVTGDLNLAGDLFVDLIDGHTLTFNQSYLIGDISGTLLGQFNGLGEGSLIGNFDGFDLFVSYAAGDGNDIALYTAIPEPSSPILLAMLVVATIATRRSRRIGNSNVGMIEGNHARRSLHSH